MSDTIRILYIDDYDLDRELVRDSLEKEHGGFEVVEASGRLDFEALLKTREVDAVLSDFNIAGFEGLQVLEAVRAYNPRLPVIIVTGTGSEEIAVKAMQQGASDYVIKHPNHIRRLPQTILAAIEKTRLREAREKSGILLMESEKRLKGLIQAVPAALLVYDGARGVVDSNAEAHRLLGMEGDRLRGRRVSDFPGSLLREDASPMPLEEHPINRALSQQSRVMDCVLGRILPGRNETLWLTVNVVPEIELQGDTRGAVVTFFDVTDRKRAQEALRISEERLKLAQEASNDGMWDWGLKTGATYFSPRYYTMLGYEPGELPPSYETWSGLLHPEDKVLVEGKILEHIEKEASAFEHEFRLREKSGGWRWILGKGKVFRRDEAGRPRRVVGNHKDLDHLKKIQSDLYESGEKYWSILNGVALGIAVIDSRMKVREVNRKMKRMYPRLLTNDAPVCYRLTNDPPRQDPCPGCPARETFRDGAPHEGIVEMRSGEKKRVCRVLASPIHDVRGQVVSVILMTEDITEKRLQERQLRQSQKMESLGKLAGGIAHDFNNILSSVIGFAELSMDRAEADPVLRDDLREILVAGNRAKELVQRILAFSRKTEQEYKPVQVVPIIRESLRLMKSVLPATIEIHEDLTAKPAVILSDPVQLHQILVNLCTNAAHAMEEKGGALDISLDLVSFDESIPWEYPNLRRGDYLHLSVCDSGHGVAPELIDKIFDPYFTTKEEGKGSGLGLSVVHGIVRSHRGHISVYSEVGKGTTVHVYLPLAKGNGETPEERRERSAPGGTERILLVDDEAPILTMQRRSLERLGYAVTTSRSGAEALEMFLSSPDVFDLIITDMTMPGISGDDLAGSLKAVRPDIPVILCTGFSTRVDERSASHLPIDAFLMKPVDSEKMAMTVRNVLDKKRPFHDDNRR